jgi:hypothetical protein
MMDKEPKEGQEEELDDEQEGGEEPRSGEEEKTFSQDDLNRIVEQRLKRERARYADYDDLKEAAKKLKELKDAELSEKEKLEKRIQELEDAEAEAKQQAQARELEINEKLIRAEVRLVAGTMGFSTPDDAYALAELADVSVEEDGSVKGVDKALEKLAKAKPYLLDGSDGKSLGTPPRGRRGQAPGEPKTKAPNIRF